MCVTLPPHVCASKKCITLRPNTKKHKQMIETAIANNQRRRFPFCVNVSLKRVDRLPNSSTVLFIAPDFKFSITDFFPLKLFFVVAVVAAFFTVAVVVTVGCGCN